MRASCTAVPAPKAGLQPPRLVTDARRVITSEASLWWRRYVAFGRAVALGGAAIMLSIAAVAHSTTSIPLVVIGAAWAAIGVASWLQLRHVAYSVTANDGRLFLVGALASRELAVEQLAEFKWSPWDLNRLSTASFITVSGEKIRVPARMTRTLDILMYVKRNNDNFRLPKI
jgi:hypothetical protein